jgi:transposase
MAILPPSIDDYVSENNPVRAIDAYVETLNGMDLNLKNSDTGLTAGQPAFHPSILIKLYLYGYMNRVHSSRRLEREATRNLEVIWLVGNLIPSYKTIANFRKDNIEALKIINKDFILLCRQLNLFKGDEVAVDGSFFKADASKDSIYTEKNWSNTWRSWIKRLKLTNNNWPNKTRWMTKVVLKVWLMIKT